MAKGTYQYFTMIARLGADPEVETSKSETLYARLSLATTKVRKDKEGKYVEKTTWHKVTVFNQHAEFARDYLKKGDAVHIEAELANRKWTNNEGVEQHSIEIIVNSFQQVGKHSVEDSGMEATVESGDLNDIE